MVEVNNHESGDLKRYRAHYDVIVMNPLINGNHDNPKQNKAQQNRVHILWDVLRVNMSTIKYWCHVFANVTISISSIGWSTLMVETEIFQGNSIITATTDALGPGVALSSVPMALPMQVNGSMSYTRNEFNYLCHVSVENW